MMIFELFPTTMLETTCNACGCMAKPMPFMPGFYTCERCQAIMHENNATTRRVPIAYS